MATSSSMGASAWMASRTWRRSGLRTNLPHSGQPSTPHVGLGSEGLHPQHAQQARTCMSSLTMVDYLLQTRVLLGPAILPALWSHLPGAEGTWLGGFHSGESRSTGGAQKQGDSALISVGAWVLQAQLGTHRTLLGWMLSSGLELQLTLLTTCCSGVDRLCFWNIRELILDLNAPLP